MSPKFEIICYVLHLGKFFPKYSSVFIVASYSNLNVCTSLIWVLLHTLSLLLDLIKEECNLNDSSLLFFLLCTVQPKLVT